MAHLRPATAKPLPSDSFLRAPPPPRPHQVHRLAAALRPPYSRAAPASNGRQRQGGKCHRPPTSCSRSMCAPRASGGRRFRLPRRRSRRPGAARLLRLGREVGRAHLRDRHRLLRRDRGQRSARSSATRGWGSRRSASMPRRSRTSWSPTCTTTTSATSNLPARDFHLQDREMAYAAGATWATGGSGCRSTSRTSPAWCARSIAAGRVPRRRRGACPGISLHLVGGHSHGLQFVASTPRAAGRGRLRCRALLRRHGERQPVPDRAPRRRDARRASRCRRLRRAHHMVPATIPW